MTMRFNHPSFVTLMSVLILAAVGSLIAVTGLLLGTSSVQTATVDEASQQAKGLTNACGEAALNRIRQSPNSSGLWTLTFSSGQCSYTITIGVGQNRTITTVGIVKNVYRRLRISVNNTIPKVLVSSWQEVAS